MYAKHIFCYVILYWYQDFQNWLHHDSGRDIKQHSINLYYYIDHNVFQQNILPVGANPRMSCGNATFEQPAALSQTLKHVSGSAQATVSVGITNRYMY